MTSKITFKEIETSDEEQGLSEFEIDDSENVKDTKSKLKLRHCLIYLLVIVLVGIGGNVIYYFIQNYDYEGISARIMGHAHHHKKTCEDFEFGCCEIYDKCVDKTSYLESKKIELSIYRITAHDTLKTNCPSLESLINNYNKNLYPSVNDCGEFGCCFDDKIEVGCDHAMIKTITDGNNNETVNYFNSHKKFIQIMQSKKDARGSNCGQWHTTIGDVVSAYTHYYRTPQDDLNALLGLLAMVVFFWFICELCSLN